MKTILATLALITTMATSAMAADFDNNTYGVTVTSGALDFALDANEDGLTDFEVGATGLAYTVGAVDANVRGALSYNLDTDTIGVRGEYNVDWSTATNTTVYGTAAVEYATVNTDLKDGDFFFDPSVGASYAFSDGVSVFGEVGYTWNASDDWSRAGGYVEVGVPFTVVDNVTVTPSLVRGFDTGSDETNFNLSVGLKF
jgi:opacity protein-like surface antigen